MPYGHTPSPASGVLMTAQAARIRVSAMIRSSLMRSCVFGAGLWLGLFVAAGQAQEGGAAGGDTKSKPPVPVNLTLGTKDGIPLRATYYQPEDAGKETIPIILLHGWKGQRGDYQTLATELQRQGHSCLVPDLRGHGESPLRVITADGPKTLDADELRRPHFAAMVQDIEACKNFLLQKHNEGLLNIELLTIVAADMSTVAALNWVVHDWSWQQLPGYKQGQDVKALVMLSPDQSYGGYSSNPALRHPLLQGRYGYRLSLMLIAGSEDADGYREAQRLHNSLKRYYDGPPAEQQAQTQELFLITPETSLEGTKLLTARSLKINELIGRFVHQRIAARRNLFPGWSERRSPL